jgi:hypothetical protein
VQHEKVVLAHHRAVTGGAEHGSRERTAARAQDGGVERHD